MGVMTDLLQQQQRSVANQNETLKQIKEKEQLIRKQEQAEKKKLQENKLFALQELEAHFSIFFEQSGTCILHEFYNINLRSLVIEKIVNITTSDEKQQIILLDFLDNKYENVLKKVYKKFKLHETYVLQKRPDISDYEYLHNTQNTFLDFESVTQSETEKIIDNENVTEIVTDNFNNSVSVNTSEAVCNNSDNKTNKTETTTYNNTSTSVNNNSTSTANSTAYNFTLTCLKILFSPIVLALIPFFIIKIFIDKNK